MEVKPNLIDASKEFMRLDANVENERKKGATTDMWDDHSDKEYRKKFKKNPFIDTTHELQYNKILLDF